MEKTIDKVEKLRHILLNKVVVIEHLLSEMSKAVTDCKKELENEQ